MASIRKDIQLGVGPQEAWAAVRDFMAVHDRVAAGFVVATREVDGDRIVTFTGGAEVRERLVTVDDGHRRLVYAVVDSALGLTHHQASVEIVDSADGRARLLWITDLLPEHAAPTVAGLMDQGASAIATTLAG